MKNNLFYYATSELSQDAFICWLSSFALDNVTTDMALKACAKKMIIMFVPELASIEFRLVDVQRQVGHIDVLLTVESVNGTYKIIVEDKTFTSEHDNQLSRYLKLAEESFPGCKARGVYYKTGFQCNLSTVEEAGYIIVSRKQMLNFLSEFVSQTGNRIFLDYFEYWNDFQSEVERYKDLPISKWDWKQVNGFYDDLKTTGYFAAKEFWMGYDYVANQMGGFYGLWTGPGDYKIDVDGIIFELYLQVETTVGNPSSTQLCLKLCSFNENTDKESIRTARDQIVYEENWSYKLEKYNFKKPKRLAIGRHMTIGVYDATMDNCTNMMSTLESAISDYKRLLQSLK